MNLPTIALLGAGGKMGARLARKLKSSSCTVRHVAANEFGQKRLRDERGIGCVDAQTGLDGAHTAIVAVPDTVIGRITASISPLRKAGPDRRAKPGIRPEHIVIDPAVGTPAKVVVVEPKGSETHVKVRFAGQPFTCVLRERVRLEARQNLALSCGGAEPRFFDPQTSMRIG